MTKEKPTQLKCIPFYTHRCLGEDVRNQGNESDHGSNPFALKPFLQELWHGVDLSGVKTLLYSVTKCKIHRSLYDN